MSKKEALHKINHLIDLCICKGLTNTSQYRELIKMHKELVK